MAQAKAKTEVKKASKKAETANSAKSGAIAVVFTGGKQYKVREGDTIKIEKLSAKSGASHKVGDKVVFDQVLLLDNAGETSVGMPFIAGSKVEAEIKEIGRDAKIMVIHYKPKSKYFKKYGHRQPFFKVAVTKIA